MLKILVHNAYNLAKMDDMLELIPSTPCKYGGYMREFNQMSDHCLEVSVLTDIEEQIL